MVQHLLDGDINVCCEKHPWLVEFHDIPAPDKDHVINENVYYK